MKKHEPLHRYQFLVKEHHLDSFGHVNHATYLELFEEARWEMITERSYGLEKIQQTGIGPIILEAHIRYLRELKLRQKISIETSFANVTRKIALIRQRMLDDRDRVCAEAEFKMGLLDLKDRKLIPATEDWIKAVGMEGEAG